MAERRFLECEQLKNFEMNCGGWTGGAIRPIRHWQEPDSLKNID